MIVRSPFQPIKSVCMCLILCSKLYSSLLISSFISIRVFRDFSIQPLITVVTSIGVDIDICPFEHSCVCRCHSDPRKMDAHWSTRQRASLYSHTPMDSNSKTLDLLNNHCYWRVIYKQSFDRVKWFSTGVCSKSGRLKSPKNRPN